MTSRRTWIVLGIAAATAVVAAQTPARSGIDRSLVDSSVRAQDNFFRYVNGGWLSRTQIPPDRAVYASFIELGLKSATESA